MGEILEAPPLFLVFTNNFFLHFFTSKVSGVTGGSGWVFLPCLAGVASEAEALEVFFVEIGAAGGTGDDVVDGLGQGLAFDAERLT